MKCLKMLEIEVEIMGEKGAAWKMALKYLQHFMFTELELIDFTLEKLPRTLMINKGKKNPKQLDNDKVMKKTSLFR